MRKIILIIFVLLLLTAVSAEKITMFAGDSYSDEDKNVTILKFEDKKALVCVNNQKGIVAKDKRVDINGVIIEMTRFYTDSAKFDIVIPNCYKCGCKDDCLNLLCQPPQQQTQENQQESQATETTQEPQKTEIIEPEGISAFSIITVILIILIVLLGIYSLWKKVA